MKNVLMRLLKDLMEYALLLARFALAANGTRRLCFPLGHPSLRARSCSSGWVAKSKGAEWVRASLLNFRGLRSQTAPLRADWSEETAFLWPLSTPTGF